MEKTIHLEKLVDILFWEGSEPKVCALHDIVDDDKHISIACNFAHWVRFLKIAARDYDSYQKKLSRFKKKYEHLFAILNEPSLEKHSDFSRFKRALDTLDYELEMEYLVQTILLRLYLLAERIELVLKVIYYPIEYKEKNFKALTQVTRWANFLKHPRESFFSHTCDVNIDKKFEINDFLVQDLWSGEKKAEKTKGLLQKKQIKVIYPSEDDLIELITNLANELLLMTNLIKQNPVYQEIVTDRAALEKYFALDS